MIFKKAPWRVDKLNTWFYNNHLIFFVNKHNLRFDKHSRFKVSKCKTFNSSVTSKMYLCKLFIYLMLFCLLFNLFCNMLIHTVIVCTVLDENKLAQKKFHLCTNKTHHVVQLSQSLLRVLLYKCMNISPAIFIINYITN